MNGAAKKVTLTSPPKLLARLLALCCAIFFFVPACSQNARPDSLIVVFYNVENLFDTRDDSLKLDEEFTPEGSRHWTFSLLDKKVKNLYRAIIAASKGVPPDIVGLAEVENLWVVEYLLKATPLAKMGYQIIHKESPDPRGIDVALLYRSRSVRPLAYEAIPVFNNVEPRTVSRDILHAAVMVGKARLHFFVNHWPSRSGGYVETRDKRDFAAEILRAKLDSLLLREPSTAVILMGDFNATPNESCFRQVLSARLNTGKTAPSGWVNLSGFWLRQGKGTIKSNGCWEIFDQFICTSNLIDGSLPLIIDPQTVSICEEAFLLEDDVRFLGTKPFRTFLGPAYHGGVSDHLPISLVIKIE